MPSTPTPASCWHNSEKTAIVIADGSMPQRLNGIDIMSWSADAAQWQLLAGADAMREPPFQCPDDLAATTGVMIVEDDGRLWLMTPSEQSSDYTATFPKGSTDEGSQLGRTAVRVAFEQTGLKVTIIAFLVDLRRSRTYTRYYLARRIGGTPADMGWQSQAVLLVPPAQLRLHASHQHDAPLIDAFEASHFGKGSASLPFCAETIVETTAETVILPFLSARTLAEHYELVAEIEGNVAIYKHKSGQSATIGTRGQRPRDGASGLIVHDDVTARLGPLLEHRNPYKIGLSNLSYWRATKSPIATLLNVLDQHGVILT